MTSTAVAITEPDPLPAKPRSVQVVPAQVLPVFLSDAAGTDRLHRGDAASLLAEVAAHPQAETPVVIGVFGPAGSGKTQFLRQITERLDALSGVNAVATPSPSTIEIATLTVDAAAGQDPIAALTSGILAALAARHPGLAEDAIYAASDPREAARLAEERVDALRRTLDAERQGLDDLAGRRARLAETVLFDAAGSRVDTYARGHRARIEARLRAFGLPTSDAMQTYKQLVRETAEASGPASHTRMMLRSLWSFEGQGKLLATAIGLVVLGVAAGFGAANQETLSGWLASSGDRFAALTDWERAHLAWLQPLSQAAFVLAGLALLALVVRAIRFLGPILRGATLLKGDLDGRRRDLDGLLAHQTRRVDALADEVEAAARNAEATERRMQTRRGAGISDHSAALASELFGGGKATEDAATAFFAALSSAMERHHAPNEADRAQHSSSVPDRIVVAIDHLDRLPAPAAAAFLNTTHRLLARPNIVTILAMERGQIASALAEDDPALASSRLDRVVQLSYDLGAEHQSPASLVDRMLEPAEGPAAATADGARAALDRPLQPFEKELLRRLSTYAGATPRAIKRFVNTYRVARADARLAQASQAALACLAWALALDGTSAGSELAFVEHETAQGRLGVDASSELGRAFAIAQAAVGQTISAADARRGMSVARSFSRRG